MTGRALAPAAALSRLIAGDSLSRSETEDLFGRLMDGDLIDSVKAALLVALAAKGESADEIAGAATAMRRRLVTVPTQCARIVDTCGTGGDRKGTFNISTAAALVAAAAGVPVAKHGNRSVSSRSGSADLLEALGVEIETTPERAATMLDEIGIVFLFAPHFHPAMREVAAVRGALGVRTIFNILGPLTNPAGARRQVLGVYEERLVELLAQVLAQLGCDHALVVQGSDGLDELTTTGASLVAEVRQQAIELYRLEPDSLGLDPATPEDLAGGEPHDNAELLRQLVAGEPGPLQDISALNAGAAIYVGGIADSLEAGLEKARQAIESGAAEAKLQALIKASKPGGV